MYKNQKLPFKNIENSLYKTDHFSGEFRIRGEEPLNFPEIFTTLNGNIKGFSSPI